MAACSQAPCTFSLSHCAFWAASGNSHGGAYGPFGGQNQASCLCVFLICLCTLCILWAALRIPTLAPNNPAGGWDQRLWVHISPQLLCALGCSQESLCQFPPGDAGGRASALHTHSTSVLGSCFGRTKLQISAPFLRA